MTTPDYRIMNAILAASHCVIESAMSVILISFRYFICFSKFFVQNFFAIVFLILFVIPSRLSDREADGRVGKRVRSQSGHAVSMQFEIDKCVPSSSLYKVFGISFSLSFSGCSQFGRRAHRCARNSIVCHRCRYAFGIYE